MASASKLRAVKPIPMPANVKPAPLDDYKPEFRWVSPTELLVDETYQRNLSERSVRLLRRLVENFAWNRFKPPIVVKAGPSLHVVDGQHTAIAAATIGIPKIPVFVVQAATIDARARAFVGHNTDRVIVSPFDIYRALLASGDPDAVDVDNTCRRAGVRLRLISPSSAIAEGDTAAIGLVRRLVAKRGPLKSRKVLQVLVKGRRAPISQGEILAAERLICEERPDVDLEALAAVIQIEGDKGLAAAQAAAKAARTQVWRVLLDRWTKRLDGVRKS